MKRSDKVTKVPVADLVVNKALNFRIDYDLASLMEEIRQAGRVLEPIHVRKEDNTVLKGNRRALSCIEMLKNPAIPADLKANIEKIDVIYYSDLSEKEVTELILDHGSQKSLNREECVAGIWRLQKLMYSERDIITLMYNVLARYTGNVRKASEVATLPPGEARDKTLQKWLHGTVGNFILAAGTMGDLVREQFLLTERAIDRQLTDEEKKLVKFTVSRDRIGLLTKAKTADKDKGGWDPVKGGEKFNAQIAEFIEEDSDPKGKGRKSGFTATQMEAAADMMNARGLRLAFLKCASKLPEGQNAELEALDVEYARRDKVDQCIRDHVDAVADPKFKFLLQCILTGTDEKVKEAFNAL